MRRRSLELDGYEEDEVTCVFTGDGTTSEGLAGSPEGSLLERLVATHAFPAPGEFRVRARLELDWLYGFDACQLPKTDKKTAR